MSQPNKLKGPTYPRLHREWMADIQPRIPEGRKKPYYIATIWALLNFARYEELLSGSSAEVSPSLEQIIARNGGGASVLKQRLEELEELGIISSEQRFGTSTRRKIHRWAGSECPKAPDDLSAVQRAGYYERYHACHWCGKAQNPKGNSYCSDRCENKWKQAQYDDQIEIPKGLKFELDDDDIPKIGS